MTNPIHTRWSPFEPLFADKIIYVEFFDKHFWSDSDIYVYGYGGERIIMLTLIELGASRHYSVRRVPSILTSENIAPYHFDIQIAEPSDFPTAVENMAKAMMQEEEE